MSFDWYKRHSGDWLEVEQHLTLEQVGALNVLADMMHKLNASLVDDDRRLAGLLGVHWRTWRAIRKRLLEVGALIECDGRLDCLPILASRRDRQERSTKASRASYARLTRDSRAIHKPADLAKINDLETAEESRGERGIQGGSCIRGNDSDRVSFWRCYIADREADLDGCTDPGERALIEQSIADARAELEKDHGRKEAVAHYP